MLAASLLCSSCGSSNSGEALIASLSADELTVCVTATGSGIHWVSTSNPDGCLFGGTSDTLTSENYYDGPGGSLGLREFETRPDFVVVGQYYLAIGPDDAVVTSADATIVDVTRVSTPTGGIAVHLIDPAACLDRCTVEFDTEFGRSTSTLPWPAVGPTFPEIGAYE